jgi:ribonuclease HI
LLVNPQGKVIEQIARFAGNLTPFEAEIAALAGVLQTALERGVERIRVHTDCKALVRLWRQNPEDRRLASARALANEFRRFVVWLVLRQHNQVANRLARSAALAGECCRSEPPG